VEEAIILVIEQGIFARESRNYEESRDESVDITSFDDEGQTRAVGSGKPGSTATDREEREDCHREIWED
jgi:hypothetical protein